MQKLRAERAKQAESTGKFVGEHKEKWDRADHMLSSLPNVQICEEMCICISVYTCSWLYRMPNMDWLLQYSKNKGLSQTRILCKAAFAWAVLISGTK